MEARLLLETRDLTHPSVLKPSHSGKAVQITFSWLILAAYTTNMSYGGREGGGEEGGGEEGGRKGGREGGGEEGGKEGGREGGRERRREDGVSEWHGNMSRQR